MAFGIGDLLQSLQQGVQAVNNLRSAVLSVFPSVGALSTSATIGAITFSSSQPSQFLTVITSSGGTYKTPLYLP